MAEGVRVALTSGSVEMEHHGDLLAGRGGRDGNLRSPEYLRFKEIFIVSVTSEK